MEIDDLEVFGPLTAEKVKHSGLGSLKNHEPSMAFSQTAHLSEPVFSSGKWTEKLSALQDCGEH